MCWGPGGPRWEGGGLAWVATDDDDLAVHQIAAQNQGHALRVRGHGPAFQPRSDGIKTLEARVANAFDPHSIFDSQFDG